MMASWQPVQPSDQTCQRRDSVQDKKNKSVTGIPTSWKLTEQQRAFIDSFDEDEEQKQ
ncbi:hypothetical protein [Citrobacter amalonaticus]|uniref:hypothetical protein n=1 Tax=Citrobacter amalonaticus TaxID=35703 RepID=UPI0015E16BF6|nr:hypothetical protein [Citrobacter amalonaticus]